MDLSLQTSEAEGDMVSNTWASDLPKQLVNRYSTDGFRSAEGQGDHRKRLTRSDRSPWFEDDEEALFGLEPLIRCRAASTRERRSPRTPPGPDTRGTFFLVMLVATYKARYGFSTYNKQHHYCRHVVEGRIHQWWAPHLWPRFRDPRCSHSLSHV